MKKATIIFSSIYFAIGFFISHLLHIYCYWSQGGTILATWLIHLSPKFSRSMHDSLILAGCLSALIIIFAVIFLIIFSKTKHLKGVSLLFGFIILILLLSQTISASLMRLLYETGYSFIFIMITFIHKIFLKSNNVTNQNRDVYGD